VRRPRADEVAEAEQELELGAILDFMRALWSVDHGLQSASKRMSDRLGVTGPQRIALRMVGRFPGVSAGRLATILALHPSTLTGILQRLVDRGLVARVPDPKDRRRVHLELTARGKQINATKTGTVEAIVERTLRRFPAARVIAARNVLLALAEELAKHGD
jgi:DNA-binding MarR family transcriptional regulator